ELAAHPVSELKAVGPKLEGSLAEMEIQTVLDLIQHYPRRYHDRTKRAEIAELTMGEEATVFAEVKKIRGFRTRQGRAMVEAEVFTWQLRKLVAACLQKTKPRGFAEPLGTELLDERGLVDRTRAYRGIHRPETHDDHSRAAERLKFDEFVRMQVGLVARKRAL